MFNDDDPFLEETRSICMSFPEATEKISHGQLNFRAGKVFAIFNSSEYYEEKVGARYSLVFKPDPEDSIAFKEDSRIFIPPYWGPFGWLGLNFEAEPVDWQEVRELVDASYRQIALKRLIKILDQSDH